MPLPDERPRQSVANLIGRFENQTKRQSVSAASTSVVSHITGDSVKEEIKEKREWPPKSVANSENTSTFTQPTPRQSSPTIPATASPQETSATAMLQGPSDDNVPQRSVPADAAVGVAKMTFTPRKQGKAVESNSPQKVGASPTKSTAAKPSPTHPKVAANPAARTPAKQSLTPLTHPLKPQHTGASTTSTQSTRKTAVTNSASRAKTPSRPVASSSRAKTPTLTRPKTPSSGLFAPTAASLARSRASQPPPPTPTKKATLSSSAAERLSKPTAASLSKARTLPPTSPAVSKTAPRTSAGIIRGTPKSKPTPSSPLPKAATTVAIGGAATAVAAAAVGIVAVAPDAEFSDRLARESIDVEPKNVTEDSFEIVEEIQEPETIADNEQFTHEIDPVATDNQYESPHDLGDTGSNTDRDVFVNDLSADTQEFRPEQMQITEPDAKDDISEANMDVNVSIGEPETRSAVGTETNEVGPLETGNDIEDIVDLLEATPINLTKSEGITGLPDEVQEIPSEDF